MNSPQGHTPWRPDLTTDQFAEAYGEPLERALDPRTWLPGEQLRDLYCRLESEVDAALRHATETHRAVREHIFRGLEERRFDHPDLGDEIGLYQATPEQIRQQHRGLLFNGGVEAADGTNIAPETLLLSVVSLGVVLVAYDGDHGSWGHRLFRRDLSMRGVGSIDELVALLDARSRRDELPGERRSRLGELGRDGIMAYMERAVLLEFARAPWRMGHGNPVAFPMLTGSGSMEFLRHSLDLLRRLIDYERFVFVQSTLKDRDLLTVGDALRPLEYVIYDTAEDGLRRIVEADIYTRGYREQARAFVRDYGPKLVRGVYRASEYAPPRQFFAHRNRVHEAALLALADSVMQEHRGFPLLIDLADAVARATFDPSMLGNLVQAAFASRGRPFRYLPERATR
jgi:hypothetical protein